MKLTLFDAIEANGVQGTSDLTGLDVATISRVKNGKQSITERIHNACFAAFGVKYDELGTVARSLEMRGIGVASRRDDHAKSEAATAEVIGHV